MRPSSPQCLRSSSPQPPRPGQVRSSYGFTSSVTTPLRPGLIQLQFYIFRYQLRFYIFHLAQARSDPVTVLYLPLSDRPGQVRSRYGFTSSIITPPRPGQIQIQFYIFHYHPAQARSDPVTVLHLPPLPAGSECLSAIRTPACAPFSSSSPPPLDPLRIDIFHHFLQDQTCLGAIRTQSCLLFSPFFFFFVVVVVVFFFFFFFFFFALT